MNGSAFQDTFEVIEGEFPELNEALLPAPALNISAFYLDDYILYGHDWTDPRGQ